MQKAFFRKEKGFSYLDYLGGNQNSCAMVGYWRSVEVPCWAVMVDETREASFVLV